MTQPRKNADRGAGGKFLPGNRWRLIPGKRIERETRVRLQALPGLIQLYLQECELANRHIAWAGLAAYLGISRQSLDRYLDGVPWESDKNNKGIQRHLNYFRTILEATREEMLPDKKYQSAGVSLALKAGHGWRDADAAQPVANAPTFNVVIPAGPLLERLQAANPAIVVDAKPLPSLPIPVEADKA